MEERKLDKELLERFEEMLKIGEVTFFDADEFELVALYFLESDKLKKSLRVVDFALEIYDSSQDLLLLKAQILVAKDQFDEALDIIENLPDTLSLDINLLKSTIYQRCDKVDEAIELLKKTLTLDPNNSDIYFSIGYAYQSQEKYQKAIKYYKRSIELDLSNELALYELSFCLEVTNQLEEAVDFYQKFIDVDPYAENAWYNLGSIYHQLNKNDKAKEAFEFAVAVDPTFSSAHFNLGSIHMQLEEFHEAIQSFEECLEHEKPSAEIYCKIAECYEQLKNENLAFEFFRKSLNLDKNKEDALIGVASILYEREKYQEAIFYVNKAKEQSPNNYFYWHLLANTEYKLGNEAHCLEAFEKSVELNPKDKNLWKDYAFIYYDQKEFDTAFHIINIGIEHNPEEAELYYLAFVFSLKGGNIKDSINILENALILDPEKQHTLFDYFDNLEEQKAIVQIIDKLI